MSAHHYIIIVAAGSGSRFGGSLPKQFVELAGKPVLAHTVEAFRAALPDAHQVLVLSENMMEFWADLCRIHGIESPQVTAGGASRWESVKNALAVVSAIHHSMWPDEDAVVLVHDGARPLVSSDVIKAAAKEASVSHGAIPAVAVIDSLRRVGACGSSSAVDRSELRAVQTPQAFRLSILEEAYRLPFTPSFTDDASVVEAAGFTDIVLTPGSPRNIKITNPDDIAVAEALLAAAHSK